MTAQELRKVIEQVKKMKPAWIPQYLDDNPAAEPPRTFGAEGRCQGYRVRLYKDMYDYASLDVLGNDDVMIFSLRAFQSLQEEQYNIIRDFLLEVLRPTLEASHNRRQAYFAAQSKKAEEAKKKFFSS